MLTPITVDSVWSSIQSKQNTQAPDCAFNSAIITGQSCQLGVYQITALKPVMPLSDLPNLPLLLGQLEGLQPGIFGFGYCFELLSLSSESYMSQLPPQLRFPCLWRIQRPRYLLSGHYHLARSGILYRMIASSERASLTSEHLLPAVHLLPKKG